MKNRKKETVLCKTLAAILCFAIMVSAVTPVTAQAASRVELALKYKGKTVVVEKLDADDMELDMEGCHQAAYEKIEKAFGDARQYESAAGTAYEYKDNGFLFSLIPWSGMYSLEIKITSKKAALNGIKVGMSYSNVKKKLEKKYGKSRVITQGDKKQIQLTYGPYMPIAYSFKNGKVNKIYFFHS